MSSPVPVGCAVTESVVPGGRALAHRVERSLAQYKQNLKALYTGRPALRETLAAPRATASATRWKEPNKKAIPRFSHHLCLVQKHAT